MSTGDTYNTLDSLDSQNRKDPFELLEKDRNQHLGGNPTHGDVVRINNGRYLVQTRGSPEGTNVYVFGEVLDEEEQRVFPNNPALRQTEEYEDIIPLKLGLNPGSTNVEFAEYDTDLEPVSETHGSTQDVYFKLDGEL